MSRNNWKIITYIIPATLIYLFKKQSRIKRQVKHFQFHKVIGYLKKINYVILKQRIVLMMGYHIKSQKSKINM